MKIMAPAGDRTRMNAAVQAGADEVYMGLAGFGARRFAGNFSVDEYLDAIKEAHRFGVAVNLTLNTVLSDKEFDSLYESMARLYGAGLDAVIVQDFGVARWLHRNFPELPLHASTQMSLAYPEELALLSKRGFNRAVLARELSLDEIARIKSETDLELEIFVSGALCLCCSGKCYLSSFIGGRSGNRGMCTQPCRQLYQRSEPDQNGLDEGYFLSLKDQWHQRPELEKLIELGIDSVKLEGRMKSPYYVYETVRYYRQLIDEIMKDRGISPLTKVVCKGLDDDLTVPSNGQKEIRPGQIHRAFEQKRTDSSVTDKPADEPSKFSEHDPEIVNPYYSSNFGVEIGRTAGRYVELSAPVRNGDGIVYLDKNFKKITGHNVSWIDLVDSRSFRPRKVDSANKGETVLFENDAPPDAVYVFKTSDYLLEKELEIRLKQTRRYSAIDAELTAKVGQPLCLKLSIPQGSGLSDEPFSIELKTEADLAESRRIAADPAVLKESIDRFGETPFFLNHCQIMADSNVFVPKSELNQLRQKATAELEKKTVEKRTRRINENRYRIIAPGEKHLENKRTVKDLLRSFSAVVQTETQFQACLRYGVPKIHYATVPVLFPNVEKGNIPSETVSGRLNDPLAGSIYEAILFEKMKTPYSVDWTFNVGNSESVLFLSELLPNMDTVCLSPEISENACQDLVYRSRSHLKNRPLRFALPVYGFLAGMFTRKTLFKNEKVELVNQDGRSVTVFNNQNLFPAQKGMTGSTVRYSFPLDIIDAITWILEFGIDEVRFDFTKESGADILEILERATHPQKGRYSLQSYGFGKGIF